MTDQVKRTNRFNWSSLHKGLEVASQRSSPSFAEIMDKEQKRSQFQAVVELKDSRDDLEHTLKKKRKKEEKP